MTVVLPLPVPTWERPRDAAVLAGVCAAVSRGTRAPLPLVRALTLAPALPLVPTILMMLVAPFAGWSVVRLLLALAAPAVLGYAALWWALPAEHRGARALADGLTAVRGHPAERPSRRARGPLLASTRWLGLSLVVSACGAVLVGTMAWDLVVAVIGWGSLDPATLEAVALLGVLAALAGGSLTLGLVPLADLDADRRESGTTRTPVPAVLALLVGGGGFLLAVFAGLAAVAGAGPALMLALVALGMLALLSLLLVPWGRRLWAGLREETEHRAVIQHQQETTAHLHDSVLQSLVILQRPGLGVEEMRRLARQQERELRRWLYSEGTAAEGDPTELRAAVETIAAAAEDAHGARVRTVVVGDAPLTEQQRPLLAALKEAVLNACRHGGGEVDVFLDLAPAEVTAFVRDRGEGFDMDAVPEDRLGVRESILGRMRRAGGEATVGAAPGGGTEVMLRMPARSQGAA
ncbi:sensor histidine kinase [Brachybacterium squillarum]|uniref:sensor histidine kinase n=1 Tax=Brachybacterium squillarum TaxID=661979 RepID=UPI002222E34D|nr:sensor histidine kinase [Brachybacterium squillarum]MCW1804914.1 hypothetical protein [Brachybacterium squillarum]